MVPDHTDDWRPLQGYPCTFDFIGRQWDQVFILDRIGNNGFTEPQNAQDAKLLAPVIFMLYRMKLNNEINP